MEGKREVREGERGQMGEGKEGRWGWGLLRWLKLL